MWRHDLAVRLAVGLAVLKPPILGTQYLVQFFDKLYEFLPVLFDRNKRTKFLNTVTLGFVHGEAAVLQLPRIRYVRCRTLPIALTISSLGRDRVSRSHFSQKFGVLSQGGAKTFQDFIQFNLIRYVRGGRGEFADPIFQTS
jgi:hypothetical protein